MKKKEKGKLLLIVKREIEGIKGKKKEGLTYMRKEGLVEKKMKKYKN